MGGWNAWWSRRSKSAGASLRFRVLALTLGAFLVVAVPATIAFGWIVDTTVVKLGTLFAERQILYDRHRGLEALNREVALAETLARSPVVSEWARDEFARDKYARGLAELEHFRAAFADNSYFFVVHKSGNYYFNDKAGAFTGNQRRYTLDPQNTDDEWYYKTVGLGQGCHLNVNHDRALAVTKVWINCVITQQGEVLGVLGTGIDLTMFIRNVVESDQRGVESMFVDRFGAVQANRNESLIDFRSLTRSAADRKTFFQLLDAEADRSTFSRMIAEVTDSDLNATARFLTVDGQRLLVGVGFLHRLGWYNVTLMDIDQIIDRRLFGPIALLLALMMLAAAMLVAIVFKRSVLDRLNAAEAQLHRIERGDFSGTATEGRRDEIGRLLRALNAMSRAVGHDREQLEAAVRARTSELERIAYIDSLTGILNRRGLIEAFAQLSASGDPIGLMILDIDRFKAINDEQGHIAGDGVIEEFARRLIDVTGPHDICARWGGDEFVVMMAACDPQRLRQTGERVLEAIGARPVEAGGSLIDVTTSIGGHLLHPGETLEKASARADIALYRAKEQGRDCFVLFDPVRDGGPAPAQVA